MLTNSVFALCFCFLCLLSACSLFSSKEALVLDDDGPSSEQWIDDSALEKLVARNILNASIEFADSQIEIVSHNGWVLITGQVGSAWLAEQAALVTKNTPDVKQVHNHLQVGPNRTMLAYTNDGWIKLKVRNRLGIDKQFPAQKIIVHTDMGIVYLLGRIRPEEATQAVNAVEKVKSVQKIVTIFEIDYANDW